MQKNKISSHQLYALTALTSLGGSVLVISSSVAGVAKQDAWISALVAVAFGLLMIRIYGYLGSQYPEMTFIGLIKKILGKWVGLAACAGFVFFCLTTAANIPWYISSYATYSMHETPQSAPALFVMIAIVIAILYGIEVIGRASELFLVFITVLFFGAMLFLFPAIKLQNVQPILENGIVPVLKGAVLISNLTVFPVVIMMMVYPINIEDIPQAKKAMMKGFSWASLIVFFTVLMSTLVLGAAITAKLSYPALVLFKEIRIGEVLTRIEYVVSIIWDISQFVVGVMYAYSGILGLSELLGLIDYKKIVIPVGLVIFVMSQVVFPDTAYQGSHASIVWPLFMMTFGFVLPILLLLVDLIKKVAFKKA